MRKQPGFRPTVDEPLEERLVMSASGLQSPAAALASSETPQQIGLKKVEAAYTSFTQSFVQAVGFQVSAQQLAGGGYFGSSPVNFAQELAQSLSVLNKEVVKALDQAGISPTIVTQVKQSIAGSSATSLDRRLYTLTSSSFSFGTSVTGYTNAALTEIQQSLEYVKEHAFGMQPSPTTGSDPHSALPAGHVKASLVARSAHRKA